MFNKLIIAAAALAVTLPVNAGSIHDFAVDADYGTPAARRSLDGECYDSVSRDKVCFQRIKDEIFTVSVLDVSESLYPHTFIIDCNGRWEGYGPLSAEQSQQWVDAFCDNGRY